MTAPPPPPAYEQPVSKIELRISCRNLVDMDVLSKSDPFVVMFMQSSGQSSNWMEMGRTETIMDNRDPDFVKSFMVDYFFEEQQHVKFEVYDSDDASSQCLTAHDFLGRVVTTLGSIVGENCGKFEHSIQTATSKDNGNHSNSFSRKSAGTLIVRAEEVSTSNEVVTLSLSGRGLDKKDWFGKSDPYLEFKRCNEDNSYTVVHRTEVIKNTLNPIWKTFTLPVRVLCNGDHRRNLKVYCYDWNSDGTSDLIGVFETNLEDLKGYKSGKPSSYDLHHVDKHGKQKSKKSGSVHVNECMIEQRLSFFDYITGGVAMNFVVAVDFTASNGQPNDPKSLHYSSPSTQSQYVQVLQSIGQIIEDYDADKLFPSFGFGAKLPPSWTVHHDFALNFNPEDPHCQGVQGIIGAYYNSVTNVQLYGPTNFSPIINSCARIAQSVPPGSQYFVLLIITDGIISDMNNTKQAIIDAALLPISIIIVGVGGADFDAMEELDGDDVRVNYNGRYAARDIVQFVPFRDYSQYNAGSGARLAKDVLHELPGQVVEFMEKNKLSPPGPPPGYSA